MAIDVELKTLKQNNTSWPLTFKASNRFPIVANRVFATLEKAQQYVDDTAADASAYKGIVLAVVEDSIAKNNGVYYVESVAMAEGETGKLVKVGGTETETAKNYSAAKTLSNTLVLGQLIKVSEEETVTEGEGEEAKDVTYQAGFYIVEGAGVISALATSTGSDDEVGALKGRVSALETTVGNEEAGIVKEVADLKEAVEAIEIPEVPVQDVTVDGVSVLSGGVAAIDLTPYEKVEEADKVRGRMDAAEDAIEALDAAVKEIVIPEVPVQDVTVNGDSVLGEDGVAKIVIPTVDLEPYEKVADADLVRGRMTAAEEAIEGLQTKDGELQTAIDAKVATSVYEAKVGELEAADDALQAAIDKKVATTDYEAKVGELEAADKALQDAIDTKVDAVDGSRLMTDTEGTKLAGIADGAQVNKIEVVKVNGVALTIADADKSVDVIVPTAPVQGIAADEKVLSLDGDKLKTTLTLAYVPASDGQEAVLRLQGKDGVVVSSINATAFVKDGMLADAKLDGPKDTETGEKYLSLTFNTDSGSEEIRLDVSDLIDYYAAGEGLNLDGKTFSVKVDETANSYLQVTINGIAVSQAFLDKITELDNKVLAAAQTYVDNKVDGKFDAAGSAAKALEDAIADAESKYQVKGDYEVAGAAAQALEDAKAYTDEEIGKVNGVIEENERVTAESLTNLDGRVATLEAIDHDAYVAADTQVLADAKTYTDEEIEKLSDVYDAKGAAEAAQNAAIADAESKYQVKGNYETAGAADAVKSYADDTFVTKKGFNEFEAEYEEKLNGIAAGAEVNVVEAVKVNGVEASISEKVADVTIDGTDIALGANVTADGEVVYESTSKLSAVLQGIQDSISVAISGGLTGVVGGNGIEVSAVAANKQTVSAKVSTAEGNLISVDGNGLYAAMYYDGDDAE